MEIVYKCDDKNNGEQKTNNTCGNCGILISIFDDII